MLVDKTRVALDRLEPYNKQLEDEMNQRNQLGLSLHAYRSALQESIELTRNCIQVCLQFV